MRTYQPKIIPGLLQTAGYTTALLEDARDRQRDSRDDIAEAVAEREARQRVLTRAGRRFVFVIEEQVLRYRSVNRRSCASSCCTCARPRVFPRCGWGSSPWEPTAARCSHARASSCSTKSWSAWSLSPACCRSASPARSACTCATSPTWPASPFTAARPHLISTALHELARRGANSGNNFDQACACSLPSVAPYVTRADFLADAGLATACGPGPCWRDQECAAQGSSVRGRQQIREPAARISPCSPATAAPDTGC